MESKAINKKTLILNSLKWFFLILVIVIAVFNFFIGAMFYISPKFDAKVFNFFGLKNAEEKCYERIFKKSDKTADLYNLVEFEKNIGDEKEELDYILMLYSRTDFNEFCDKLDTSGIYSANGKKVLYPYVADTRAYLMGQEVTCMFNLALANKADGWFNETKNKVATYLQSENLTETTFQKFMSLLYETTALTNAEKQEIAINIKSTIFNNSTFENLIDSKIEKIANEKNGKEVNAVRKILLLNAQIQMYQAAYFLETLTYINDANVTNTTRATDMLESYKSALSDYNKLVA